MKKNRLLKPGSWAIFAVMVASYLTSCAEKKQVSQEDIKPSNNIIIDKNIKMDTATFGSGCFWCTEAFFQNLEGVYSVSSGYTGGQTENPTYKQICQGNTGHAEVIQVTYDPNKITYDELLEVFWKTHDPTTLNRQGNDEGTQYRSAIFYHNESQKQLAEKYKKELNESGAWNNPIVTEISPISKFYKAEDYHQNYYNQNKSESYCAFVIQPKLEKFKKVFHDKLKK